MLFIEIYCSHWNALKQQLLKYQGGTFRPVLTWMSKHLLTCESIPCLLEYFWILLNSWSLSLNVFSVVANKIGREYNIQCEICLTWLIRVFYQHGIRSKMSYQTTALHIPSFIYHCDMSWFCSCYYYLKKTCEKEKKEAIIAFWTLFTVIMHSTAVGGTQMCLTSQQHHTYNHRK